MKKIDISDLPNPLNEHFARVMMEMEEAQTEEWQELSANLPFEIEKQYFQLKAKLQKRPQNITPKDWDREHIAFLHTYVDRERHYSDYTIEDVVEITADNSDFYSIEKLNEMGLRPNDREYILLRQAIARKGEPFTFFWNTTSAFSQWHRCQFKAVTFIEGNQETKEKALQNLFPLDFQDYSSAEQFMMYHKAMIFLDREMALKIMRTQDVRKIKDLGRQVKNFDENIWKYFRSKIVYEGNKAKFTQNEDLKQKLFATKGTTLVEAAGNDCVWGIGLSEENPGALLRKTWLGKNLLGEILTQIRMELMGEY